MMGMTDTVYGAQPVYSVNQHDGGMFGGGNSSWVFFLFFLLLWGREGLGGLGGNGQGAAVASQINNDFMYGNLNNTLQQGFTQTINRIDAQSKDIYQGFAQLANLGASQTASLQAAISQCCCDTNRNVDALRYETAKQTCDIINAQNLNTRDIIASQGAGTQAILDKLNQSEIQGLRDRLTAYEIQLSNQAQTAAIVSQVRPYPVPSYPICPPQPPFPPVA